MSKCTATIEADEIDSEQPVPCSLDAGHNGAHVSDEKAYVGVLWNDSNYGATPHHEPGAPEPATNRHRPTITIQPTGSQFEDWLQLKARAAGWDTSSLAAALGVTEQELRDAYTPEKRQQDVAELRADPGLADAEALMDRIVDAGGHWEA